MKQAIRKRTGKLVDADYTISKSDQYLCPFCRARVQLRSGYYKEPYFAHYSHEARKDCEEYHEGYGYYGSYTFTGSKQTKTIVQSKIDLENHNQFTSLCIKEDKSTFQLYLSIPSIPLKKKLNFTFTDLQKTKLHLTADDIHIQQMSIVKLFTTGLKTELGVKPTEKNYVLTIINNSTIDFNVDFLEDSIEGLSPEGNLFCRVDEEWIRILPNTEVEWGGDYYFVAEEHVSVPYLCKPKEKGIQKGYSRRWKCWRITLPTEWNNTVEVWLSKIGYYVVESRWKLQLLSIPQSFQAIENKYYFDHDQCLLFKATSPFPHEATVLICELQGTKEELILKSNSENNCFFAVKSRFDKVYLDEYEETTINIEFTKNPRSETLSNEISDLPILKFHLGEKSFQSLIEIQKEEPDLVIIDSLLKEEDIEIKIHPEGLNSFLKHKIDIYLFGDRIISRYGCSYKEAEEEILSIFRKEYQGILIIDAGSLGIINLNLQSVSINTDQSYSTRTLNWLSAIGSSSEKYVGSTFNIRKLRNNKNLIYKIAHDQSSLISTQARAFSKKKK